MQNIQETHIAITEHEDIINEEIQKYMKQHEEEIKHIKVIFEQELRKAEKKVKEREAKETERAKDKIKNLETERQ